MSITKKHFVYGADLIVNRISNDMELFEYEEEDLKLYEDYNFAKQLFEKFGEKFDENKFNKYITKKLNEHQNRE